MTSRDPERSNSWL